MKTITIMNEKGGVGKTTIAVHLAAGLAIRGHNVLLLDADAQGNASIAFGAQKAPGFYELLVRNRPMKEVSVAIPPGRFAIPDDIPTCGLLALLPSNLETRNIAQSITNAAALRNRLQAEAHNFDYVIIDTAPTPSLLHSAIIIATDWILVPTTCEEWSLDGLEETIQHLSGTNELRLQVGIASARIAGIIPTMYRRRTIEHEGNYQWLNKHFGKHVWPVLGHRTIWKQTASSKEALFKLMPVSKAADEMWAIVDRVEKVTANAPQS